jgi:PAS domain S-box-containing protein
LPRKKWIVGGIAAVLVALAAVCVLLVVQADEAATLRREVEQSYKERLVLEQVLSLHQDVETGGRGFLLTGNPSFLEPFDRAIPEIALKLDDAARLGEAARDPQRLARLRAHSAGKIAFVSNTVELAKAGRNADAVASTRSGRGKALMDQIRAEIERLQRDEQASLAASAQRFGHAQQRLRDTAIALLVGLMALLCIASAVIVRATREREQALAKVSDLSRRRAAILNAAMDGIFILNPSGSIEAVNMTGARMFGYREDELLRRDIGMLFASNPPVGQVAAYLRQMNLQDGAPGHLQEIPGRCKDGTPIAADVAISAVELVDGVHYVAMVRDMSERRKIDRLKAEFVASVSHELRTPLTSIAGSLGLLAAGRAGELPPAANRLVGIANNNAERLVRLINDILDIEKIDAGRMSFDNRNLDLDTVLATALEANTPYAERLGVQLELAADSAGARVWADPDRLQQALANLISNAAKFSPKGSAVRIVLTSSERMHRISVADSGPGIDPAFANRIFNRFAQADSSDARERGGTGLGLSIVREIATRLGGSVSYDSVPGHGATFHLDLPRASEGKIPAGARILVCEADAAVGAALAHALGQQGFSCDVAASASEARERLDPWGHRLVLIDSALPGGAIALIRELCAAHPQLPILMMSAEAGSGAIAADALQVAEWLPKPVPLDRIVTAVDRLLAAAPRGRLPRVLHVDDDPDLIRVVAEAFAGKAEMLAAEGIGAARAVLAKGPPDAAILDLGLADGSGLELLPELASTAGGPVPVVVFSAQDSDPLVAARVHGFLTKSQASLDTLVRAVGNLARGEAAGDSR